VLSTVDFPSTGRVVKVDKDLGHCGARGEANEIWGRRRRRRRRK
jgi:hypothetical protein